MTGGGLRRAMDPEADQDLVETAPLEQLSPDQMLGRYRVVGLLGAGGMGEVYEADDEDLGRSVAIKVLPARLAQNPDAQQRIQIEARAVSALNHPNICTLHDIGSVEGRPFLVFELIEGPTLRRRMDEGPLAATPALELTEKLARALHSAHERGILHRDIKPANIAFTSDGEVKLLDFGIAKALSATDPSSTQAQLAAETLTRAGQMPGTVAYMSPEQIRGQPLDGRSDVFALGAVLYEMVAGRKAFAAGSAGATIEAVLTGTPPSLEHLGHGSAMQRLVSKALAKDPDDRFASAEDFADAAQAVREAGPQALSARSKALRLGTAGGLAALVLLALGWLGSRWVDTRTDPIGRGASVAVLSFATDGATGADEREDFLEIAVADEILQELLVAESLAVRPFSSSSNFTLTSDRSETIGRALGADVLVGGRVRRSASSTFVTIEAIRAESGDLLWRETVRAPVDDLLEMDRRVSDAVHDGLLGAFGIRGDETTSGPTDEDAYRLYLQARTELRDREPNRRAIELLRQSVSSDPNHAAAWFELGQRLHVDAFYYASGSVADELEQEAQAAFERNLALQPGSIEAVADLINLELERGAVRAALRRATDLAERRPDLAAAQIPLAIVLRYAGAPDRSAELCDRARSMDPREPLLRQCALSYLFSQRTDDAWESSTRSNSLAWQTELRARIALVRSDEASARELWLELASEEFGLFDRSSFLGCFDDEPDLGMLRDVLGDVLAISDGEWKFYSAGLFAWCERPEEAVQLLTAALDSGYCVDPSAASDLLLRDLPDQELLGDLRRRAGECRNLLADSSLLGGGTASLEPSSHE